MSVSWGKQNLLWGVDQLGQGVSAANEANITAFNAKGELGAAIDEGSSDFGEAMGGVASTNPDGKLKNAHFQLGEAQRAVGRALTKFNHFLAESGRPETAENENIRKVLVYGEMAKQELSGEGAGNNNSVIVPVELKGVDQDIDTILKHYSAVQALGTTIMEQLGLVEEMTESVKSAQGAAIEKAENLLHEIT